MVGFKYSRNQGNGEKVLMNVILRYQFVGFDVRKFAAPFAYVRMRKSTFFVRRNLAGIVHTRKQNESDFRETSIFRDSFLIHIG